MARVGCAADTAHEAYAEARDRLDWAASADPDAIRAAWLASVDSIANEAIRSRKLEVGLAALELRGRATGVVTTSPHVAVHVGGAPATPEALQERVLRAQAQLEQLRSAGLPARLLPKATEGGGSQEGGES